MIRSMTGFGQAEAGTAGYRIRAELKSVNHRYTEVAIRLPREWIMLEDDIRRLILRTIRRGRVDAFIAIERESAATGIASVNWPLAEAYVSAADQLRKRFGLTESLSLKELLAIPELVNIQEVQEGDAETLKQALGDCIRDALARLAEMREREGRHLYSDLLNKIRQMQELKQAVADLAPQATTEYHNRLSERLREMLREMPALDSRIAMEAAIYAERASIDEELTRLDSHFAQFEFLLQADEPTGRKIDFLIQEMNREVNTIGSKSANARISGLVVDLKAELEKIREQVQNVE